MILFYLLCFSLAISARSLWVLAAALIPCQLLNYPLLKIDAEEQFYPRFRRYLLFAFLFSAALAAGVAALQHYAGMVDYAGLEDFSEPNAVSRMAD